MRGDDIFLDCCVLMDFFAGRKNGETVEAILSLAENKKLRCFTSGSTVCTLAFLFEKYKILPKKDIPKVISSLLDIVRILPVGQEEISWAVQHSAGDFEDAVQCACADPICDTIVTDDVDDFRISTIRVYTPENFLNSFLEEHPYNELNTDTSPLQ